MSIQPGRESDRNIREWRQSLPALGTRPLFDATAMTSEPVRHRVAIALGSNLGDSRTIIHTALKTLDQTPHLQLERQSRLYQTAPVGPPQPDYLNACALFLTTLPPQSVLDTLLAVEQQFGRVRQERWGPRLLDLDLLLYDDWILQTETLQIPHPRMTDRAFVLIPLTEIAPDCVEPISQKTIAELSRQMDISDIRCCDS